MYCAEYMYCTYVLHVLFIELSLALNILLASAGLYVLYLQMFQPKIISILFKISAWALFLKYSSNFANFSLDILIKYLSNRPQVSVVYKLINHLGCW